MTRAETPIPISEIFGPTIEGEGDLIGMPTVFVRTGGCDFRCTWCDTMYAVDPKFHADWTPMEAHDIVRAVHELSPTPILVTISGGNPALRNLGPLIDQLHDDGHAVTMETQGSIAQDWFVRLDYLTVSPKPPSSGMQFDAQDLDRCLQAAEAFSPVYGPRTSLKVVVFDDGDYHFARTLAQRYAADLPFFVSVGNEAVNADVPDDSVVAGTLLKLRWLGERLARDDAMRAVRVLPQLHVLMWGNERAR